MTQQPAQLGCNDIVLVLSLLYSSLDLGLEWEVFNSCSRPIHWWLLASYACVLGFRLTHLVGARLTEASGNTARVGDFLLHLRQKDALPRAIVSFTWLIFLPFFCICTVVGTFWLYDVVHKTPQCVPTTSHLWFSGFWLALCYLSAIIYGGLACAAWFIERRVRKAEADLREIEDDDVRSRWGEVSRSPERWGLTEPGSASNRGLAPSEIKALMHEEVVLDDVETACDESDCAICIQDLLPGDTIRRLPPCGHAFHRSCIDLWLLQRADCPLCKQDVRGSRG